MNFSKEFVDALKMMHAEFEESYKLLDQIQVMFRENCLTLQKIIKLIEKFTESGICVSDAAAENGVKNVIITKNQNGKVDTDKMKQSKELEKDLSEKEERTYIIDSSGEEMDIDRNENDKFKYKRCSNKIRGEPRKFILPEEYNESDSRWTLRYPKIKKGLVELMPHSDVYVDLIKFGNCKRISKDSKTLARMLLVEIFSDAALSTCSWTGKRANAFDTDGTNVRPGLDEHARAVLLNFIEEYSNEMKWVKLDSHSILHTIRNKLQEMRAKFG